MMKARSILILTCLILLSQCDQNAEEPDPAATGSTIEFLPASKSIYGEWEEHGMIWRENFSFHKNGTFDFQDHSCTGSSYSKGNWTMDNGMIVLTSFDEYDKSKKKPHVPSYVYFKEKPSKKNNYRQTIWAYDTALHEELNYYRFDSALVYFNKRKFLLINDTLLEVAGASKFIRQ